MNALQKEVEKLKALPTYKRLEVLQGIIQKMDGVGPLFAEALAEAIRATSPKDIVTAGIEAREAQVVNGLRAKGLL